MVALGSIFLELLFLCNDAFGYYCEKYKSFIVFFINGEFNVVLNTDQLTQKGS